MKLHFYLSLHIVCRLWIFCFSECTTFDCFTLVVCVRVCVRARGRERKREWANCVDCDQETIILRINIHTADLTNIRWYTTHKWQHVWVMFWRCAIEMAGYKTVDCQSKNGAVNRLPAHMHTHKAKRNFWKCVSFPDWLSRHLWIGKRIMMEWFFLNWAFVLIDYIIYFARL